MFSFFSKKTQSIHFTYELVYFSENGSTYLLNKSVPQKYLYEACQHSNVDISIIKDKYDGDKYMVTIKLLDANVDVFNFKKKIMQYLFEKMPKGFVIVG